MKREDITRIFPDATKEQLDSVMALYGAGIEAEKEKRKPLETEIADKKAAFDKLKEDFEALQTAKAAGDEYKAKFEQLKQEITAKEAQAQADAAAKEKAEKIAVRFNAVVGDKKFSHEAIREAYLAKFTAALDDEANAGKSDADILHALTKDDAAAYINVTATNLVGGKPVTPPSGNPDLSKMSYKERAELYNRDPAAYHQLKGE